MINYTYQFLKLMMTAIESIVAAKIFEKLFINVGGV
jgi:hypothetical protein